MKIHVRNGGTTQFHISKQVGMAKKVHTTVSSGTVGELVKATMGDNDSFRIAVGGSSNNGWAELATADDGTEPIYVRQYGDAKIDGFVTPTRTATLLDAGGNTSFPGEVTAPTFSGNLNGNADTATKATQDASGNVITTTYAKKSDIPSVPTKMSQLTNDSGYGKYIKYAVTITTSSVVSSTTHSSDGFGYSYSIDYTGCTSDWYADIVFPSTFKDPYWLETGTNTINVYFISKPSSTLSCTLILIHGEE